jgi:hypothetical protein
VLFVLISFLAACLWHLLMLTTSFGTAADTPDHPGRLPDPVGPPPHAFDAAAAVGIPVTDSGHTHGGQLMLSETESFGPLLNRYWPGLYRKPAPNGASVVVSHGVGNWFPLRIGAPAEIIHLTLRSVAQGGSRPVRPSQAHARAAPTDEPAHGGEHNAGSNDAEEEATTTRRTGRQ